MDIGERLERALAGKHLYLGDLPAHTSASLPSTPQVLALLIEAAERAEAGAILDVRAWLVYDRACGQAPCTLPGCSWQVLDSICHGQDGQDGGRAA